MLLKMLYIAVCVASRHDGQAAEYNKFSYFLKDSICYETKSACISI